MKEREEVTYALGVHLHDISDGAAAAVVGLDVVSAGAQLSTDVSLDLSSLRVLAGDVVGDDGAVLLPADAAAHDEVAGVHHAAGSLPSSALQLSPIMQRLRGLRRKQTGQKTENSLAQVSIGIGTNWI